jgi:hypothetical protein
MRYKLSVAAGYAATLGWFSYHDDVYANWVAYALIFILPFVAALVAGPWAALALPAAVLIAVPAGYGSGEAELPIWFGMLFAGFIALPVILFGSIARWLLIWYARRT